VIYVGNPSRSRKATIFFVGGDKHIMAVAKVPLVHPASTAILNEADLLAGMGAPPFAPRVLFRDRLRGIAAQSWLDGESVPRQLTPAHVHLLDRLRVPGASVRICDGRSAIMAGLEGIALPLDRGVVDRACGLLEFDAPLPAFVEHGDFAPWNLKRLSDGSSGAIDWEWSIDRGLPCQDICRFFYMQDALFGGDGNVWHTLTREPLLLQHYTRNSIPGQALLPLAMHYLLRTLVTESRGGNLLLVRHASREIEQLLTAESHRFPVPIVLNPGRPKTA
jgi:hypothetical protein